MRTVLVGFLIAALTGGALADTTVRTLVSSGDAPVWVAAPATLGSTCEPGVIAYDASYYYLCRATDTWSRFPKSSQEVGFLADGGVTSLTCGTDVQGKAQVLDSGALEYCDGASTSVLRFGFLDADGTDDDVPESGDFGALTGGTGITNSAGTLSLDPSEVIGTTTWGAGSSQTWTWDAGATDPTATIASNSIAWTNVSTFTVNGTQVSVGAHATECSSSSCALNSATTATTAAADDSDTSVATTAFVQQELNGADGTNITCASGVCNFDTTNGLAVPTGTAPTLDAAGEIATDSSDADSDQLLYYDSSLAAVRVLTPERTKCMTIGALAATDDDVPMHGFLDASTVTAVACTVRGTTPTATVVLTDGTNAVKSITCGTTATTLSWDRASLTNTGYTANEVIEFDTTSVSGTITFAQICFAYTVDRQ